MEKKKGLGRGLGALLGDDVTRDNVENYASLRLAEVEPNPAQPRRYYDETALMDLVESIRIHGIITPLIVRRQASGTYQIIAGERRWRAARIAGLTQVPAVIIEADDRKVAELALIENLQREDLNALEVAEGYRSLMDEFGLTQEEVAEQVGRSRPAVANALRLLALPEQVQNCVRIGELTEGHARALLPLKNEDEQIFTARQILSGGLSVRQTEILVRKKLQDPSPPKLPPDPLFLEEFERKLTARFSRKVRIVPGKNNKGRLELEFYSPEDLETLISQLER